MVVAFTGYRPEKMPFQESKKDKRYLAFRAILSRVISRLIELGGTYFISGLPEALIHGLPRSSSNCGKKTRRFNSNVQFHFQGSRFLGKS